MPVQLPRRIITLMTDFGLGSPYAAEMRGVILSLNPGAVLVDVTHAIPPQDVRQGSLVWEQVAPRFPPDTIHVGVVDPGVGTDRKLVYAEIAGQHYLAPDNGLLSRLVRGQPAARVVTLTNRAYWLPQVSHTFHGRDILAPVAAHLSRGVPPDRLGEPLAQLTSVDWPECSVEPRRIVGAVLQVDSFGNVISNIPAHALPAAWPRAELIVRCGGREVRGVQGTYLSCQAVRGNAAMVTARCGSTAWAAARPRDARHPAGALIALLNSQDRLELAIVGGNAAATLGVAFGDAVVVTWQS